ncbi:alpha/beta fold hydrolase [Umezawaea endophytica]|uniref:Alpha/beta hydrolase n=1 Tax=Umezawaea endophytica TaxID=1654476 RepID=A0A9X2VNB3_9PSEU|nr:alpha/beta hydrolase [Umezawaea endophytica]MCS7479666.1 alpha/beta hydrolase [Umezawaea endophytica]
MTIVFVHGVPVTSAVWTPLLKELDKSDHDDVVLLSPPGFGAPLPPTFGATIDDYRIWLIEELSRFDTPVDLVGQSMGGGHVLEVAMTRPDLLRSWVSDVIGGFEPDYSWHPLAQTWQTSGEGERSLAELFAGNATDRAARMVAWGIPEPTASEVALAQNADMARAILALYRSATPPTLTTRGHHLPKAAARPGLVPIPTDDTTVGTVASRHRAATRAGAHAVELTGIGHWWMLEDPPQAARMLSDFWTSVTTS